MRLDVAHRFDLGEHVRVVLRPTDDDEAAVHVVSMYRWAALLFAATLAVEP
jgi:hypothetical protein